MTKKGKDVSLLKSEILIPNWWKSKEIEIQEFINNNVQKGVIDTLCYSPGGRRVASVSYGEAEPELRGTANFNSALGAKAPEKYFNRKKRKRPVLVIMAGIHGQEVEGMVAALSIINIMETGKDLLGNDQKDFMKKLKKLRLIVIPLSNPDGRNRVPYDGWVGLPQEEMTKYGQGTRKDGSLYRWLPCKAVHPMQGDVGLLGGYFDDDGINMMHDNWGNPMSKTTKALMNLVHYEGPDMFINIHSHEGDPAIIPVHYVPVSMKKKLNEFKNLYYNYLEKANYSYKDLEMEVEEIDIDGVPPSFNFNSFIYHLGVDLSVMFENTHGLQENPAKYKDILEIQHILFESAADYLLTK